ncbi:phosphate ABC transporter permease PstA [Nocardioides sp. CBS4Y-1]|uniref:Phosphate transport system permease protein PstA n=1 Tax=Nocardioides acrostichi TaxID=2784339 RepID=A0A930UYR3_9ACTN|nr:phosphate ABC transporter permease PstA [Nocardioides acrostichi]
MSDVATDTTFPPPSLVRARLPRQATLIVGVLALALAVLGGPLLTGASWYSVPFVAGLLLVVLLPLWSLQVEGRRAAVDRLVTLLVTYAVTLALVPLVWVLAYTVIQGLPAINWAFLTKDQTTTLDPVTFKQMPGAGVLHAIVGTLLITLGATIISVPIGLLTAIYLVEYGAKSRMARIITVLVDVMTGIPSIVAGLFAVALFTQFGSVGTRIGFMGSVALSLLMIPTVVRSGEEMMRLVPADLREASYALGVPKWRTILKVVVPTAFGGILTGVMLAVSRVIGETAPLLVAVGTVDYMNTNLFSGRMQTLPVFIVSKYKQGADLLELAWGAALILVILVMVLNLTARIIGKIFAPKTGR